MACNCKLPGSCSGCAINTANPNGLPDCEPYVTPIVSPPYHCSLAASLQEVADMGRMLNHELGFRPYKCYLVWQQRDAKQRFKEIKRIELMPVRVRLTSEFTRIKWTLSSGGSRPDGFLQLEDVSPNQVTEADLRGQLDGKDPPDGVEFFYEIVKQPRCAGEVSQTIRCALQSVPFLDAAKFMFVVDLKDQAVARKPETEPGDRDNTHKVATKKKHDVIKF